MSKNSNPLLLNTSRTMNSDDKPTKIGWPRTSIIAERNKKLKENFLRSQSLNYTSNNGSSSGSNGIHNYIERSDIKPISSFESNPEHNQTVSYYAQPVTSVEEDELQQSLQNNSNLDFNWYRDVRSNTLEQPNTILTDASPDKPPNYVNKPKNTPSEHGYSSPNLASHPSTVNTDNSIRPKELFGIDNIEINWLDDNEKPHFKRMISHRSSPLEIARHYEQPPPELTKTFRRATSTSEKVANLVKKYNK